MIFLIIPECECPGNLKFGDETFNDECKYVQRRIIYFTHSSPLL